MTAPAVTPVNNAAAAPASKNTLSIVAFVLSLLGFNVIAVVLGFVGLSQIKKTGQGGRGLALAAIIIGFVSLVLGTIFVIAAVAAAANAGLSVEY